jgi:hypothetical protein
MSHLMTVRDRDGELRTITDPDAPIPHICIPGTDGRSTGWGPEDAQGRPTPCLACRSHLRDAYGPSWRPGPRFRRR